MPLVPPVPFRRLPVLLVVLLMAVAPAAHAQSVLYVDADASGNNDGSSWANAYTDLQDALGAATGSDEIWIAEGVYTPGSDEPDAFTIEVNPENPIDGLNVYGGFDGSESTRSARDPRANVVVLSGDIGGDDVVNADGVTETADDIQGVNSTHVLVIKGVAASVTSSTTISGITVSGGNADGSFIAEEIGGGLVCDGSSGTCDPTLSEIRFVGNRAAVEGGAVYLNGTNGGTANPTIANAVFSGNASYRGGGMYTNNSGSTGESSPLLVNTLFVGNSASFSGGALYNRSSSPVIKNTVFFDNTSESLAAAIGNDIQDGAPQPQIINTLIWGNDAFSSPPNDQLTGRSRLTIRYSLIENLDPSGTGNLPGTTNPSFVNAGSPAGADGILGTSDDGLRVADASPIVDAGNDSALPADAADLDRDGNVSEPLPVSITGANRIQGDAVDLGTYETSPPPAPTIATFRPTAASVGATVTVEGERFNAVTNVSVGGTGASFTVQSDTELTLTLPNGATTGPIEITGNGETVSSSTDLGVVGAPYGAERALEMDGAGDWVRADPLSSTLSGASALTMEAWVRLDGAGSGQEGIAVFNTSGGANRNWLGYDHSQSKFLYYDDEIGADQFAATPSPTDTWHHVAATIDAQGNGILYVNGGQEATFTTSTRPQDGGRFSIGQDWDGNSNGNFLDGQIDQVRLWDAALTPEQLRARMHRTIDDGDALASRLVAAYRFDAGSSTTAFDYEGSHAGAVQGDPQPTAFSAARLGQESALATSGANASVGPAGGTLSAENATGSGVQLYRYGTRGAQRTGSDAGEDFGSTSIDQRPALTWGVSTPDGTSPSADLTLDYSGVQNLSGAVGLLRRDGPGGPWTAASGWSHDANAQTFTRSGPAPSGEYAVVSLPNADLSVSVDPQRQTGGVNETVEVIVVLRNPSSSDVGGVTVDVSAASGLSGLSSADGDFSNGTWTVGTVAGEGVEVLSVEVTHDGTTDPARATASIATSLNDDPNPNNDTFEARVVPPAYGPEHALALDGTDDHLNAGTVDLDARGFTIDFWAKRNATGANHYVIGQGSERQTNRSLHIGFRSNDQFTFAFYDNDLNTTGTFTDTGWNHWAVTFDPGTGDRVIYRNGTPVASDNTGEAYQGAGDLLIGRVGFENDRHFDGSLDQVRVWDVPLSQANVRLLMHRTMANPIQASLDAAYRFDAGSGTTAFDHARSNPATFQGDPQWTAFSGARLGQESAVATSGSGASVGPAGGQLSAAAVSADAVQLYRFGTTDGSLRAPSDPGEDFGALGVGERPALTWGVSTPDGASPSADLTLDYSSVQNLSGPVVLLRRDGPGAAWSRASGWTHDTASQQFTRNGAVPSGQYAVAEAPPTDLALTLSPTRQAQGTNETATVTATVTNAGSNPASGASVAFTAGAGLSGLSSANANFSGTTWTIGTLGAGATATLELTATYDGTTDPASLDGTVSAAGNDPTPGNDTFTARVQPPPFGAAQALTFDGTDDALTASAPIGASYTLETWFRTPGNNSAPQVLAVWRPEGNGGDYLILSVRDDGRLRFLHRVPAGSSGGTDVLTTAPSSGGTDYNDDQWHHVAVAYDDATDTMTLYVDGSAVATGTADDPIAADVDVVLGSLGSARWLNGAMDQTRLWNAALTEAEIRERMHRTIDPGTSGFDDLIASYRFDAGTGTTAYDHAGSNSATFQGDPQWTAFSGARLGQESAVATSGSGASVGPAGGQLSAAAVSAGVVQLYRSGTSGAQRTGSDAGEDFSRIGIGQRPALTWGISTPHGTNPSADLTLDYSSVQNLSGSVVLVRRDASGAPWTEASGWTHDPTAQTFTRTGTVAPGEYALVTTPTADVSLAISPQRQSHASGETATFTATVRNPSSTPVGRLSVDLTAGDGLSNLTSPSGDFSNGTWTVGTVPAGATATLEATAAYDGATNPASLTGSVTSSLNDDPNAGNNSSTGDVVPAVYGPGTALAFDGAQDGSGAYVQAPTDALDTTAPFTVEAWIKWDGNQGFRAFFSKPDGNRSTGAALVVYDGELRAGLDPEGSGPTRSVGLTSTPANEWIHVATTYDGTEQALYVNGEKVDAATYDNALFTRASSEPVLIGREFLPGFLNDRTFPGQIDQVRTWSGALTEEQVHARMHQTIEPNSPAASNLVASYRFDAGTGSTAYDYAGSFPGTLQNGAAWQSFSGARLGQESAVVTDGSSASVGPNGATLTASNVATEDTVQVYRFGTPDGAVRTGADPGEDFSGARTTQRRPITWGVATPTDPASSADLTIDYSGVQNLSGAVLLLRRDGPGDAWSRASGWTHDTASQQFTRSGTVAPGQLAVAEDPVLYVDAGATGAGDGSSWTDAFPTLQEALDEATGTDQIWMAAGTYYPDDGPGVTDDDRSASFIITGAQDGLALYGGFDGTETTLADRDLSAGNKTILSGDIDQDGALSGNSYHVLVFDGGDCDACTPNAGGGPGIGPDVAPNVTSATVLDGVTVAGGNANESYAPHDRGGGLYCDGVGHECSPMIQNTIFSGNAAALGGAILNNGSNGGTSSPQVVNATFTGNTAAYGGAMANSVGQGEISGDNGTSSPQITNATFNGNTADNSGGAIVNFVYTGEVGTINPVITNTILWDNGDEVANSGATPQYSHSIIQGSGGSANWDGTLGTDNGNNLDAGPQFVNASDPDGPDDTFGTTDDGLRVGLVSPALDAGDDSALPSGVTTDLAGASRVQNGTVDLGAYEGGRDGARIYHVDASAGNDSHTGLTWNQAVATLTQALDLGTGNDEIWIAAGTYHPDQGPGVTEGDRTASFTITGAQDGLKIYGGFAGTESSRDARAPREHPVILSGDIGTTDDASDNSHTVVYLDGTTGGPITTDTELRGFTVTGGHATGSSRRTGNGGGIYCNGAGTGNECSPTLAGLILRDNAAAAGDTPSPEGGAIFNDGTSGGTSSPHITNTVFTGNEAVTAGGAITNNGEDGTSSPRIANCLFVNNSANGFGGAIRNNGGDQNDGPISSPSIVTSTFVNNSAFQGGALFNRGVDTDTPSLTNVVLHGNTASDRGDQIANNGVTLTVGHTLLEGGLQGISGGSTSSTVDGGGNLDAGPQFVDESAPAGPDGTLGTADDGLLLRPGSPAVDAGTNSAIPSGVTTDLLGTDRTQDSDGDGTATVTMGAYETVGNPAATSLAIGGTDGTGNDRGWRLLGAPYAQTTADALRLTHAAGTTAPRLENGVVALWDDSAPSDQDGDPTGGYVSATSGSALSAGQGFLLFLLDDSTAPVEDGGVTVSVDDDAATLQPPEPVTRSLTASARWHLLANPHPTSYRLNALTVGGQPLPASGFQADVQIYDAPAQTWRLKDASAATRVAPWQGFFLERSAPGSGPTAVTFEPRGRTQGAPFVGSLSRTPDAVASAQRGQIGLRVTARSAVADTTVLAQDAAAAVRFHKRATDGFDAYDASKLDPLAETFVTLAPVGPARGDTLAAKAIESRPWWRAADSAAAEPVAVPLRLTHGGLPDGAQVTVSARRWTVPDGWTARLTDTRGTPDPADDRETPFDAGATYTAPAAAAASDTTRFVLTVAPSRAALPVELAAFDASVDGEAVRLTWHTASEQQNAGFVIQRRTHEASDGRPPHPDEGADPGTWTRVGFVEGAGTTAEPQTYRFTDPDVPFAAEQVTYRLRQVDTDGTQAVHDPVTVTRAAPERVRLHGTFPNPASAQATLRYALPAATDVRIALYDVLGRRVMQLATGEKPAGRYETTVDVSRLAPGSYFYRLTADATTQTRRLTVVR